MLPAVTSSLARGGYTELFRRSYASGGSTVKEITTLQEYEAELKQLADSGKLGVIDFTAKWCGPCKAIAPVYEQLSKQHPDVSFYKLDIDNKDVEKVVVEHGITGVPTFTFYKGPRKADSFTGARLDLLKETIEKLS